jgi:hypothetical protein
MREHAAVTTYDQLVAIVRRADLTAGVVILDGPFARRLDAELGFSRNPRTMGNAIGRGSAPG